jgi:hypothetical protein
VGTNYPDAVKDLDEEDLAKYKSNFIKVGDTMLPKMNKYLKWGFPQEDCLILMDTEREREIGLGN